MKKGIAVAGSILVDILKDIDFYPDKGMLANVISVEKTTGGCVCNTLIDLARLDSSLPLYAFGRVGKDDNGIFVNDRLKSFGINTDGIVCCDGVTGFSDVMNVHGTGERTFFHMHGENDAFCVQDVDIANLPNLEIFHAGYILLLQQMDAADEKYGTKLARLLHDIRACGIKTSVDVVSSTHGDYRGKVVPALKYCSYIVINEIEACAVCGLSARDDNGKLLKDNVLSALKFLVSCGVQDWAVVHCPEGSFAMNSRGELHQAGSLELPVGFIRAGVGAGDAFCAGFLYAMNSGFLIDSALDFAACCAACNLSCADANSGIKTFEQTLEFGKKFSRSKL